MSEYRVELSSFNGPLDLLFHLVRRHEIDLHDIPIAKLTEQYLSHLASLQRVDIDLAGEFLVMASTLLEIKSKMLIPLTSMSPGTDEDPSTIESLDPRHELVQQLLAYKQFCDAASAIDQRRQQWEASFVRRPPSVDPADHDADLLEFDLEDANLFDLSEAFTRVLESIGHGTALHKVVADEVPLALHAEDILDRLSREGPMTLESMFVGRQRSEWIGLFLAMLELVREKRVHVFQDNIGEHIKLELRDVDADLGDSGDSEE